MSAVHDFSLDEAEALDAAIEIAFIVASLPKGPALAAACTLPMERLRRPEMKEATLRLRRLNRAGQLVRYVVDDHQLGDVE